MYGPVQAVSPTLDGSGEGHWDDETYDYGALVAFHLPPTSDADSGRVEASMNGTTGKVRWHVFGGPPNGTVTIDLWLPAAPQP
jgi:hypothetical protein